MSSSSEEGFIFKKSDKLFYEGMIYFYLGEYEKTQEKMKQSLELKKLCQKQQKQDQGEEEE